MIKQKTLTKFKILVSKEEIKDDEDIVSEDEFANEEK